VWEDVGDVSIQYLVKLKMWNTVIHLYLSEGWYVLDSSQLLRESEDQGCSAIVIILNIEFYDEEWLEKYMRIYRVRTDRPAIMSMVVLHWAAISVLGMEYGSLPCWQMCYFDLLDEDN